MIQAAAVTAVKIRTSIAFFLSFFMYIPMKIIQRNKNDEYDYYAFIPVVCIRFYLAGLTHFFDPIHDVNIKEFFVRRTRKKSMLTQQLDETYDA